MKLYNLNFHVNFKNNFRPFAAPSKCRPVRPAPPAPLATPVECFCDYVIVELDGLQQQQQQFL